MRFGGLIPIIILTIILAVVLALGSVLSNLNLPEIKIESGGDEETSEEPEDSNESTNENTELTISTDDGKTHKFNIELADTPEKRALGLMNRTELGEKEGMLFVYGEEGLHGFWMKDTLIALDLIHINNGEVVEVIERMQPCDTNKKEFAVCPSYPASTASKYSLEVKAGTVQKLEIRVGDKVKIEL